MLHILDGVPLGSAHIDQRAQLRRHHRRRRRRRAGAVVVEVELRRLLVEEELAWVVELLEDVLNEEVAAGVVASRALVADARRVSTGCQWGVTLRVGSHRGVTWFPPLPKVKLP